MAAGPPPLGWFPLAFVALIPLWRALWRGEALWGPAIAWGLGFHGCALFWIWGIHPMTWMGVPWIASWFIALVCWLLITAWGVLLTLAWAVAVTFYRRWTPPPWAMLVGGGFFWCLAEAIWARGPLFWTYLALSQSPTNLPLLHLAQWGGPTAIALVIVLVNGLLARAWEGRSCSLALAALAVWGLAQAMGWWLYLQPLNDDPQGMMTVGLIQGNIPNEEKLYEHGWQRAIAHYDRGYNDLAVGGDLDWILTPETALPFLWGDLQENPVVRSVRSRGVPLWLGAFGQVGKDFTNSLFLLNGEGQASAHYDKVKLVPLGEYIPFQAVLGKLIDRLSPLDAHLLRGDPQQRITTPWGKVALAICYESTYPEHFRDQVRWGAQWIISAANNAHYSATMPAQHHAQDVMRAIEGDRWLARATNTGYSAIIDPHGRTVWQSPLKEYSIHRDRLYRRSHLTIYSRWGDWLLPLLGAISLGGVIVRRYSCFWPVAKGD